MFKLLIDKDELNIRNAELCEKYQLLKQVNAKQVSVAAQSPIDHNSSEHQYKYIVLSIVYIRIYDNQFNQSINQFKSCFFLKKYLSINDFFLVFLI